VDRREAEMWIRARVAPVGAVEVVHERPWATVLRVRAAEGLVWFEACGAVQAFEPRLTACLSRRWPDRVAEVLDHDPERGWLLLADAGGSGRRSRQPARGLAGGAAGLRRAAARLGARSHTQSPGDGRNARALERVGSAR
jgi:hypothetical protein